VINIQFINISVFSNMRLTFIIALTLIKYHPPYYYLQVPLLTNLIVFPLKLDHPNYPNIYCGNYIYRHF